MSITDQVATAPCTDCIRANSRHSCVSCARDSEDVTLASVWIHLRTHAYAADFLDGPLRAQVSRANKEDDVVDEFESVRQHQSLHLTIVNAAPVRPGQESPTDLDLASFEIVAMKSRRTDDAIVFAVNRGQRATRLQRFIKKFPEDVRFVSIRIWMLLPDQRVGRDFVQRIEIVSSQWP